MNKKIHKVFLNSAIVAGLLTGQAFAQFPVDIFLDRNPELYGYNIFEEAKEFSKTSCGAKHCYGIKNGALYVVGYNNLGQLGLGDKLNRFNWTKVGLSQKIIEINAYGDYGILITKEGVAYSTGANAGGKIGQPDKTNYESWTKIKLPQNITLTENANIVLTERNSFIFDEPNQVKLTVGLMLKENGKFSSNPNDIQYKFVEMNDTKEKSENAEYRVLPEIKKSGRKFFDY